jgi:hypothetical protein
MYKIVGADGRVYGPVSAEQVRQWIAEGRANAQTQTLAEGAAAWKPLSLLPEFTPQFAAQVPPVAPTIPPLVATPVRKINGYALWGLIFGILSTLCCCGRLVFIPLGIIFSLVGLSQINLHPGQYEGRIMAIIGLALSLLGLVIGIVLLIIAIASGHFTGHWNFTSSRL